MLNLNLSKLFRSGVEVQHNMLYSLVTLPATITATNGILFFGDTEGSVGRHRTNLTKPNEAPGSANFEIHGIGVKFTAAPTVLWTALNDATRDSFMVLIVNGAERLVKHLGEFLPAMAVLPSFSAAAGDNPVITHQGPYFVVPIELPILLPRGVNFTLRVFFATQVASIGSTVMGVFLNGLIDKGAIDLDGVKAPAYGVPASAVPARQAAM